MVRIKAELFKKILPGVMYIIEAVSLRDDTTDKNLSPFQPCLVLTNFLQKTP